MGALGGVIQQGQGAIDAERILRMSRAMMLRGTKQRGAYLNGGIGILHNDREDPPSPDWLQPITLERNGSLYTLAWDGQIVGIRGFANGDPPFSPALAAEWMVDAYLQMGAEFVGLLSGSFSLVLCDEARGELLLARDRNGSRPLFYRTEGANLSFASEIKALLRELSEPVPIQADRLRAHLIAPCGVYGGEALYGGISTIPAGHCGIFSRVGLHLFPYGEFAAPEEAPPAAERSVRVTADFFCPDRDTLRSHLTDALFAFDYPQFDLWMSGLLRALEQIPPEHRSYPILVEDPTPCVSLEYAGERADRLGALRGVSVRSVIPMERSARAREARRMERLLEELLEEVDSPAPEAIWGANWKDCANREKSIEKRIRMKGLLYQTALWLTHYPIQLRCTGASG